MIKTFYDVSKRSVGIKQTLILDKGKTGENQ